MVRRAIAWLLAAVAIGLTILAGAFANLARKIASAPGERRNERPDSE